jgi:2-polyprenyl-3-methyl-5-hydroxy-6-metoxy-1,4-benzoquinol methylase
MINTIHARLNRPERGWDPVPAEHAQRYAADEWGKLNSAILDDLEARIGPLAGRRVLDLGGGPGQYTVAMAQRGARVTWHDVSRRYLELTRLKALEAGVQDKVQLSLGYMDEAPVQLNSRYDLVFNRICWNYGLADSSFADVIYSLVEPGGHGYVDTTHSAFKREQLSATARLRTWLNDRLALKLGHPYPPHGRLARLFMAMPMLRLQVDYTAPLNDRILFQRAGNSK